MSFLVFLSLIIKAIGSVLEIASQSLISQRIAVETYGSYSFFVSIAEGIYSLFFCGIIKFNNYYIPQKQDVSEFRKKLYLFYALPIMAIVAIISFVTGEYFLLMAGAAGFLYFCAMDRSSRMMSIGRYTKALIGEYCLGRSVVVIGILILLCFGASDIRILYVVYGMQYIVAILYYKAVNRRMDRISPKYVATEPLDSDAVKKYCVFQSTEIAHTITMQTSVIVQYIFVGAYETAIVSIVLVVRKLINFITGPTSKLYQPEFTKRYHAKDMEGLGKVYAQITRTQLCFIAPAFTILIARPDLLLKIYNESLISYGYLIRYTAFVFLGMIVFGPLANFLCMTGHEKNDSLANWISVFIMYAVMFLTRSSSYFVVFGFCAQTLFANIYKFTVFLRYMHHLPMPLLDYVRLIIISGISIGLLLVMPSNLILCLAVCAVQFVFNFIFIFPKDELRDLVTKIASKVKRD